MIVGGYGGITKGAFLRSFGIIECAWFASLVLVGAGMSTAWKDPPIRLIWIFAIVFTLLVSMMNGSTRFRIPFALPIALTAALGARNLARGLARRSTLVGMTVALVILIASASKPLFLTIAAARYESPREIENPDWVTMRY